MGFVGGSFSVGLGAVVVGVCANANPTYPSAPKATIAKAQRIGRVVNVSILVIQFAYVSGLDLSVLVLSCIYYR